MKTKQQIIKLANTIRTEADNLPEFSCCGDDNSESVEELLEIYHDLYSAAGCNKPKNTEVRCWINGDPSGLDDYS